MPSRRCGGFVAAPLIGGVLLIVPRG